MKLIQFSLFALASALALSTAYAATPSDPYYPQQWYLHNDGTQEVLIDIDDYHNLHQKGVAGVDIGWAEAQELLANRATSPVTVAVIDSGIDPNHPDLVGRVLPDGFNFLKDGSHDLPPVFDDMGHGTHVSGIIAANADNKIGITGVTPSSIKILPLRVLSKNFINFSFMGRLISDYAADAINYAVDHGAKVINMSFGWPKLVDTANARKAVQNAIDKGVLIVAAAGNDRKSEPTYPCDYEGVLCVGAVTNTGALTFFSNMGGITDILAPGDGIVSLYPLQVESRNLRIQGYENLRGTSQAAPLISGIAATLRSIYPDISLNELKARIFASSSDLPQADAALYGSARLNRAIEAQPQAVYLPQFKGMDAVSVDEATLSAQGAFTVTNLWSLAQNVKAQILINGKAAGDASADQLASGDRLTVPWKYQFASLEESSQLHFEMRVSDSSGKAKSFTFELPAVRAAEKISTAQAQPLPPANWIGSNLGKLFSRFTQVQDYPALPRLPAYFQIIGANDQGSSYQLFDPSQSTSLQVLNVPGITVVGKLLPQVIRIDANGDGKLDWLVAGVAKDKGQLYFQFYFVNSSLQPLWGSVNNSSWRVLIDGRYAAMLRNYATPGSWIKSGDKLLPAFVAYGVLPDPDNYRPLSQLHFNPDTHLYYLSPKASDGKSTGPVELEVRAIDSKAFRDQYGSVRLLNLVPMSSQEQAKGHLQVLVGNGDNLDSTTSLLDLRSVSDFSLSPSSAWDSITANGQLMPVLDAKSTMASAASFSFFDEARGTIAWDRTGAQTLEQTDFEFKKLGNPISGMIGALDLGAKGRFWFLETFFDIAGFYQPRGGDQAQTATLPIERDSSFPGQTFSEFFNPIVVGTDENPIPGVYIDSTIVRGNRVAVATYDTASNTMSKPLRYSLQIPNNCVQMSPIHLTESPSSFALPMFCAVPNGAIEYRVVQTR